MILKRQTLNWWTLSQTHKETWHFYLSFFSCVCPNLLFQARESSFSSFTLTSWTRSQPGSVDPAVFTLWCSTTSFSCPSSWLVLNKNQFSYTEKSTVVGGFQKHAWDFHYLKSHFDTVVFFFCFFFAIANYTFRKMISIYKILLVKPFTHKKQHGKLLYVCMYVGCIKLQCLT